MSWAEDEGIDGYDFYDRFNVDEYEGDKIIRHGVTCQGKFVVRVNRQTKQKFWGCNEFLQAVRLHFSVFFRISWADYP